MRLVSYLPPILVFASLGAAFPRPAQPVRSDVALPRGITKRAWLPPALVQRDVTARSHEIPDGASVLPRQPTAAGPGKEQGGTGDGPLLKEASGEVLSDIKVKGATKNAIDMAYAPLRDEGKKGAEGRIFDAFRGDSMVFGYRDGDRVLAESKPIGPRPDEVDRAKQGDRDAEFALIYRVYEDFGQAVERQGVPLNGAKAQFGVRNGKTHKIHWM